MNETGDRELETSAYKSPIVNWRLNDITMVTARDLSRKGAKLLGAKSGSKMRQSASGASINQAAGKTKRTSSNLRASRLSKGTGTTATGVTKRSPHPSRDGSRGRSADANALQQAAYSSGVSRPQRQKNTAKPAETVGNNEDKVRGLSKSSGSVDIANIKSVRRYFKLANQREPKQKQKGYKTSVRPAETSRSPDHLLGRPTSLAEDNELQEYSLFSKVDAGPISSLTQVNQRPSKTSKAGEENTNGLQ